MPSERMSSWMNPHHSTCRAWRLEQSPEQALTRRSRTARAYKTYRDYNTRIPKLVWLRTWRTTETKQTIRWWILWRIQWVPSAIPSMLQIRIKTLKRKGQSQPKINIAIICITKAFRDSTTKPIWGSTRTKSYKAKSKEKERVFQRRNSQMATPTFRPSIQRPTSSSMAAMANMRLSWIQKGFTRIPWSRKRIVEQNPCFTPRFYLFPSAFAISTRKHQMQTTSKRKPMSWPVLNSKTRRI